MLRRLCLVLAGLVLLVLVLLLGAFGLAQTRLGQDRIASLVAGLLGAPGQPAEVTGLRGFLPFDVTLAALRLRDGRGVWLEVDDARLAIRPSALLRGRIVVEEVGARRVAVDRPPEPPAPVANEPFTLPPLPSLPSYLPRLRIQSLTVSSLELGMPILGQAASFTLDGRAGTGADGQTATAELHARRIDGPAASLDLGATLGLPDTTLRLDLTGSETGGLLAAATGRPDAGDLDLALRGEGPLADWRGRLDLDAQNLVRIGLALRLGYGERKQLGLDGTADLAQGLLPPGLVDALGTRAELALAAAETGPGRFGLEHLALRAAGLSLTGEGSADLGSDRLSGDVTLAVPDLAPFSGLATTPLAGNATAKLTAGGSLHRPTLHLALDGADLRAAEAALGRLTATVDLAVTAPLGQGPFAASAHGQALAEGLRLADRPVAVGRAAMTLSGELPPRGEAQLHELSLHTVLGDLAAHGKFDRETLAGSGRLEAQVPDLASVLSALAVDAPLQGAVTLGADVVLGEQTHRVDLALDGKASGLGGLPPGVQELIGASPALSTRATVEPGKAVAVQSLALTGSGLALEGEPRLALADGGLGGELRLQVPNLAPLRPALGQPIAGSASLRAVLGGTVDVPKIDLDGTAERLALAGQDIGRASLAGSVAGPLTTPSGSARLGVITAGQQAGLALDYRLAEDNLALSRIELTAPSTRIAGDAQLALAGPRATGRLAGEIRDLGGLTPWIGQKLAGAATLDLALTTPRDRQDAKLEVAASGLGGTFGTIRAANLTATVADALGKPALDAALRAESFAQDALVVDLATVTAKGGLSVLDVRANASGSQSGQPLALATVATLDLARSRKTVRVAQLSGKAVGQPFSLGQPATVTLDGPAVALDRLDLTYGPARVQGSLDLGASRVAGDLALAALPLASLRAFGAPPLAGTAQAKLDLSGTRKAPAAHLDASLAKLALDPAAKATTDAVLAADLRGGRLDASLNLTGLGTAPLTAQLGLPVTFALDPPAFALSDSAPLSGRIGGPIDLARAARFAALAGTQLAGTLQSDLTLAGTLQAPRLAGTLGMTGGSVQDVASGVVLRNLTLQATAAGDRLAIDRLEAKDPTGGTLSGKGGLRLLAGGGLGYDVTVDAAKARLLDNGLGVAQVSGSLGAVGDLTKAFARGKLTVDRADLEIPDSTGGPSVPTIDVKEINRPGATPSAPAPSQPFDIGFDIGIDFPGQTFVRGRGLDSEWTGKLAIQGNLPEPQIEGELDVKRGYFDLLDRRFTISTGAIDFVGSNPPIPMVNIEASAKTVDVTVTIKLQGPAKDPKLTLTSDPTLPQDEILARLLFGTSAAKVTPAQGLRLAAAVQDLQGGGIVSGALTKFRRAVGVDTLDVNSTETTNAAGETTQQTNARVGKYVTDKVYLEVEKGLTENTNKARVQVDLTPQLSVGSTVNDQSQTGVGLQWRYDY